MQFVQRFLRNYTPDDYEAVCDFLIALNRNDCCHINWNAEIDAAKKCGFVRSKQEETVMKRELVKPLPAMLPEGFRFVTLDPAAKAYSFQWLLWQGFDHGTDKAEFERAEPIVPQNRRHLNKNLSVAVIDPSGENAAYCCVWHHEHTEKVSTILFTGESKQT